MPKLFEPEAQDEPAKRRKRPQRKPRLHPEAKMEAIAEKVESEPSPSSYRYIYGWLVLLWRKNGEKPFRRDVATYEEASLIVDRELFSNPDFESASIILKTY